MTFNFLGPGLTVNVEAKVKEQIILDSSAGRQNILLILRPRKITNFLKFLTYDFTCFM